ncbi:helix-turn-helix transcriptional regulator [Pseudomonas sp. NyZ480]|uniref:XRE family transcriptional regulator n=1 Tax=Pseudomonas sp. NyZ480 TaxID=3035289 RepID=UPI002409A13A|nr:helix-turn-helix transcriptional regulator [Pseudomonas sp. NyZ480]WEZ88142.1 helix-turn-helix transcriptional regulator [Pseudomonas sp. NyZ480]
MNTSGERLRALLRECGLTPSDLAALRHVSAQHVNKWFKRGVPLARLDELAELFCVNRRWLHTGDGPKHPTSILRQPRQPEAGEGLVAVSTMDGRLLPVPLHELHEGKLVPIKGKYLRLPAQALQKLGVAASQTVCMIMPATNMAPLIPGNALLAIDLSLTDVIEGETYALLHNGTLRVNCLSLGQSGTLCLHSHDRRNHAVERYTPAQLRSQDLKILGWVFHWSHFRQKRAE